MTFLDYDLLPLLISVAIPGAVSLMVFDLFVPSERRNWSESLLQVLAFGGLNFALFFWALGLSQTAANPSARVLWGIGYLFVAPAILGLVANVVLRMDKLRPWVVHPTPSGWDHFFGRGRPAWVLLRLKDGSLAGGYYGEQSLASSFPRQPDVYLQEVWRIDEAGRFREPIPASAGMYVRVEDCQLVEFFEARPEMEEEGVE